MHDQELQINKLILKEKTSLKLHFFKSYFLRYIRNAALSP